MSMSIFQKKWIFLLFLLPTMLLLAACVGSVMSRVDEPDYRVLEAIGPIEIREYDPMIVAETVVDGEREEAINNGFRLIADYIFGNNAPAQKIAMTAPVTQQVAGGDRNGEKIAMTAPVTQQAMLEKNKWYIRFVMPVNYSMQTLPVPNNKDVKLREVPAKKFVVIRFSGFSTEQNIAEHRSALLDFIEEKHLDTIGDPIMAFYNPPWTLPFLKRHEIMVELKRS